MLASHGDGTFTVKYSDGQTEEDVPKACVRAVRGDSRGRGRNSHNASGGTREVPAHAGGGDDGVWAVVERMARELAKRAGVERKKISLWSLEAIKDEVRCAGIPHPAINKTPAISIICSYSNSQI